MYSTIVTVIFAAGFASFGSCLDGKQRSAYEAVVKCTQAAWDADASDLRAKGGHLDLAEKIEESCIFLREFGRCILSFSDFSSPVPDILYFMAAYTWQHMVLVKRAGLCNNMAYGELRRISLEAGILEKRNLVNIENDDYEDCVGDVTRKCIIETFTRFQQHAEGNFMAALKNYHKCFEKKAKTCDVAIMKHFLAYTKADEKLLEEEGQGKFGKMLEGIPAPQVEL